MARKRSHTPDEGGEDPLSQYIPQNRPTKRRRRDGPSGPPSSASINHIKGKLRDVTRTLERSKNLPADVRVEKERALAGYKLDLENAENEKRKQQMIKKYHMVRFFGRLLPAGLCRMQRVSVRLGHTDCRLQNAKKLRESSRD